MAKMARQIEDLDAKLAQKDLKISDYTKMDTEFKSVGPLKEMIE